MSEKQAQILEVKACTRWSPYLEQCCLLVSWKKQNLGGLQDLRGLFPFNWVPLREGSLRKRKANVLGGRSFHSIGFPCERGAESYQEEHSPKSREFPFNWVPLREGSYPLIATINRVGKCLVSIQLGSPARGEATVASAELPSCTIVSIQLGSPARGERKK